MRKCERIGIIIAWLICQAAGNPQNTMSPAVPHPLATVEVLSGLTVPSRRAELSFPATGVIREISVEVGQSVAANDELAALHSEIEQCATEKARLAAESKNSLHIAELEAELKQRELVRMRESHQQRACSQHELSQAEFAHKLAIARIEEEKTKVALRAQEFETAKAVLAQRRVVAPFAGVIARRLRSVGEAVDPLTPVLLLACVDPLWIELDVPTTFAKYIHVGQVMKIRYGAESAPATVCQIEPLNDVASLTFRIKLQLSNAKRAWMAGWPVEVELHPAGDGSRPNPQSEQAN